MKVGIECQRLYLRKKHGMDIVAMQLVKNLQQIDKENEYVIFVKPGKDGDCIQTTDNFKIVELKGGPCLTWEQIALPMAAKAERCDILHCTSNTAPIFTKIPLIITLHDIIYLESLNLFKKTGTLYQKSGDIYKRLIVPRIMKKCKKIITVSNFEKERIHSSFKFKNDKLKVVYNGVSEHFKIIVNQEYLKNIRDKYKLPKKFIFFLGNTDPKKNTKGVLEAYSKFLKNRPEKIPLVILDFEKKNLIKMLNEIGDDDLINHIILPGYVINTHLPVIYNMCEIFLYPSLRETFGIPMLEAMSCGAPVITSNTSSIPEVSGDAALIIDPYNTDEIARSIETLLENQELRKELIGKGFTNAAKFTWRQMAIDVLSIYKKINTIKESK